MGYSRAEPVAVGFKLKAKLPYNLRLKDFELAMQDVYDFFADVNNLLREKSLERLDDMVRPAIMSGLLSDMLTASMAKHSRSLTENEYFNGHPDLVVKGVYENNSIRAGSEGVEIKTTRKAGGAVDFHGARDQWLCVFVYNVDNQTEPAIKREPMTLHRDLHRTSEGLGFSARRTGRTRYADGYSEPRGNSAVSAKLGVSCGRACPK